MKRVQEMSLFDDDGELLKKTSRVMKGSILGEGWIYVYKQAINELLDANPTYAVVKIYYRLLSMQTYEPLIHTTLSNLCKVAGLSYKTGWQAMKWLKEKGYVKSTTVNGMSGYMVNPNVSGCGRSSVKERMSEWTKKGNKGNKAKEVNEGEKLPTDVSDSRR